MPVPKLAALPPDPPRPRHWEKRVLASYLRMMGLTQAEAGAACGRAARTVREWEADTTTWAHARTEAETRWLRELTDAARVTLLRAIRAGAGDLALRVLERTVEALAPPQQRLAISHTVGEGLSGLLQAFEAEDADVRCCPRQRRGCCWWAIRRAPGGLSTRPTMPTAATLHGPAFSQPGIAPGGPRLPGPPRAQVGRGLECGPGAGRWGLSPAGG